MSFQVETSFIQQYQATVMMLLQQQESKLRAAVRQEPINGKYAYFDQIGAQSMSRITSRHADTVLTSTPHARRRCPILDYAVADMVDDEDKLRMAADPTSPYARSQAMAAARQIDDLIIDAATDTAYTGEDGSTSVSFPATQYVSATTTTGITLAKVRSAHKKLNAAEVPMEGRVMVISSYQLDEMLNITEVKSSDYNSVKALVNGEIDTFLGFKWIVSERLNSASSVRTCLAFHRDGICLGVGKNPATSIDRRPGKNNNWQILTKLTMGATRMEELRVVAVNCYES